VPHPLIIPLQVFACPLPMSAYLGTNMKHSMLAVCAGAVLALLTTRSEAAWPPGSAVLYCKVRTHAPGADFATDNIYRYPIVQHDQTREGFDLEVRIEAALKKHMIAALNDTSASSSCNWYRSRAEAEYDNRDTGPRYHHIDWPFDPLDPTNENPRVAKLKEPPNSGKESETSSDSETRVEALTAAKKERADQVEAEKLRQKEAAAKIDAAEQARIAELNQKLVDAHKKQADENARRKADYESKLALHQETLAKATAAKKLYEEKLAKNAREVEAHKAAMNAYNSEVAKGQTKDGTERVLKLVGMYQSTRDKALANLMSMAKSRPELFDIACDQMKGNNYEETWACWGFYRQKVTQSSTSKQ